MSASATSHPAKIGTCLVESCITGMTEDVPLITLSLKSWAMSRPCIVFSPGINDVFASFHQSGEASLGLPISRTVRRPLEPLRHRPCLKQ